MGRVVEWISVAVALAIHWYSVATLPTRRIVRKLNIRRRRTPIASRAWSWIYVGNLPLDAVPRE